MRFADGSRLEARRRKGRGNTLVDGDDKPISDARLLAALGARRPRHVREPNSASPRAPCARAARRCCGRAARSPRRSPPAPPISARWSGCATSSAPRPVTLFTPRRSAGKPFYVALDAYEAAERKLRDAVVTADALEGG